MNLKSVLVVALVALIGVWAGQSLNHSSQKEAKAETAFDRVMRTQTLRCSYIVWPPEFEVDPVSGKKGGIAYDVITEATKRLNLKIDWIEEVNFSTMSEGFKTDRYDALCFSLYRDSPRASWAEMTVPFYYSGQGAFVRQDDNRFSADNLAAINDPSVTIATIDGEMSAIIARRDFPKAKTISLPQNSSVAEALMNVTTKKADITFVNVNVAALFDRASPNLIKNLDVERPLVLFSHAMAFKKGEHSLKSMFDIVIEEMHNQGVIRNILKRYQIAQGSFFQVAQPYAPLK
ncbi:MAG TPA: hypothetical protein DD400_03130 [Rhodospirillaceae bacterium]|nr:hypothetical protein [Rhodospirillaceae bacterium]